jgi:hypothetical protein
MGQAIQGDSASTVDLASGATVRFEITRIQSTADLEEKLNVTAQAGYSAGPFANVSGRFSFALDRILIFSAPQDYRPPRQPSRFQIPCGRDRQVPNPALRSTAGRPARAARLSQPER